jgi:hypothetical protein
VDYTTIGLFPRLPIALRNVIVNKDTHVEGRFSPGILLPDDNANFVQTLGPLWLPTEIEVFGTKIRSTQDPTINATQIQYPIFATSGVKNIKGNSGGGGAMAFWWLMSVAGGNSTNAVLVTNTGFVTSSVAANTVGQCPVCFRIA